MGQRYRRSRLPVAHGTIERLPFIDGIRGIAAVVVCFGHCVFFSGLPLYVEDIRSASFSQRLAWLVSHGAEMVSLFLMISAFALVYTEDVRRLSASSTTTSVFIRRRAWRIL